MKNQFCKIAFAFLLLLFSKNSSAQKSQIMDDRIDWLPAGSQYAGTLSVYLTDTLYLQSLKIQLSATASGDSDLYQVSYTTGGGGSFYSAGGTLANSVLKIGIGTFSSHPDYYAMITVMRRNGHKNQIAIHSSN